MPSTATETMLSATLDNRGSQVYDQVIMSHPLGAWLKKGKRIKVWDGGGENIESIIKTGQNDRFAARDYKTQLTFAEQDPLEVVEIPSRFINGSIMWFEAQEESNVGKTKIIDFANALIDDGATSAADRMALEFWEDGATEHLHGLPAIISAANTYQGILRTTAGHEFWRAKTGAAFTITFPNGMTQVCGPYGTAEPLVLSGGTDGGVNKLYNDLCENGGTDGPDFAITSETLYNKLWDLVGAERVRYNEKFAEIGYPENIAFKGMTIVWDRNCGLAAHTPDATTFIMLNSKYLALRPYVGYNETFKRTPVTYLHALGLFAKTIMMQWRGNLASNRPGKMGALSLKTA